MCYAKETRKSRTVWPLPPLVGLQSSRFMSLGSFPAASMSSWRFATGLNRSANWNLRPFGVQSEPKIRTMSVLLLIRWARKMQLYMLCENFSKQNRLTIASLRWSSTLACTNSKILAVFSCRSCLLDQSSIAPKNCRHLIFDGADCCVRASISEPLVKSMQVQTRSTLI